METNRQEHWNQVYQAKEPQEVSWYQRHPEVSLSLIAASGLSKEGGIIDVGGGASNLVDHLLDAGYGRPAVLDISELALARSRARLGERANEVEWYQADVTAFKPPHRFGLWHDRAVLHFLTAEEDRRKYVATLTKALEPGGTALIATFATDGPSKCSGLDVVRYDEDLIKSLLGPEFTLHEVCRESHTTPWGSEQRFIWFRFQWLPEV